MRQIRAVRSLRWNYHWEGVWCWLKGRPLIPGGIGYPTLKGHHGWWLVLRHPSRVIAWSGYVAEGGCS